AAAGLSHPSIVTVYDFGEAEGRLYIAMELLPGEDLADALRHGRVGDLAGKLDLPCKVCAAVAYAHARGVVHRDVKPANVRMLPQAAVKIMDFGLARME